MDGFPKPETNDFRDGLNAQGAFYAGEIPSALSAGCLTTGRYCRRSSRSPAVVLTPSLDQ
jgi:hypothetical protein